MQYSLFNDLEDTRESALGVVKQHFLRRMHDVYDSPYGPIDLNETAQLDLYRGAIGAMRAGDNKAWSHPVKLMNGVQVELSAPLMLLIYDFVVEYENEIKRTEYEYVKRVMNATDVESLGTILKELQ